jgi:hypothetical protein
VLFDAVGVDVFDVSAVENVSPEQYALESDEVWIGLGVVVLNAVVVLTTLLPADIYRRDGVSLKCTVRLDLNTVRALKAYPERTGGILDDMSTLNIWNHRALGSSECCFVDPMSYLHGASHICRLD